MTPEALDAWRQQNNYIYARQIDNGAIVAVVPLTYGRARITIGDTVFINSGW